MFHVDLLRPHPVDKIPGRAPSNPPPVEVEGEEEFEVEEVLDARVKRRKLEYLVRWKGYDESNNTWEPEENLGNAPAKIQDFHKRHPQAPRRVSSSVFSSFPWQLYDNFTIPLKEHPDW